MQKQYLCITTYNVHTPQTPDPKRTISPPHLEIDFLMFSGAILNILKNDTWNEIKEYHKLQLNASTFVLSAANNSKLQSNGTVKLKLYPDVTESTTLRNTSFTITFHVTNTKFIILGTRFLEKNVDSIKCSSHNLEMKDSNESKSLNFYDSSLKPPPFYSRLLPVIGEKPLYLQPVEHRNLKYSLTAYECKNKYANGTLLYLSDFSFIPLRKKLFFSIMDINNLEYPYQSFLQILIQNPLSHPLTLMRGIIGYAQQDVSLNDYQTTKYRVNEITEFMDAYNSSYLTQGISETLKKLYCLIFTKQQEQEYKSQKKKFNVPFDITKFTQPNREFLTMFNFEHTKLTQFQFENLAELLIE